MRDWVSSIAALLNALFASVGKHGEKIRVLERVSNLDQTGRAIVHGQEWTVRTEDDNMIIEQGELVQVLRIAGVKLIVEKVEEE